MRQLNFEKLLFIILFASMIACTSTQRSDELASEMSNQQITDSILNKMNMYAEVLNRQDSAALINSYVAGDEFRLYSDGKVISYEEMKTIAGGLKNEFSSVHVSWDTILVTLPGNTVALIGATSYLPVCSARFASQCASCHSARRRAPHALKKIEAQRAGELLCSAPAWGRQ